MKKSNNMIGYTWMDGRGQLFSEASAHIMLYIIYIYILYIYIQLMLTLLAPSPMCMKRIRCRSDY